jgi:hypothetical protein
MPRDRWYVGGCAARLSIVAGAGIGPNEGAAVERQRASREATASEPWGC